MQEYWDSYTSSEREQFQKTCRRLLKQTFIVRDKDEENKRAYFFVSKGRSLFQGILVILDLMLLLTEITG